MERSSPEEPQVRRPHTGAGVTPRPAERPDPIRTVRYRRQLPTSPAGALEAVRETVAQLGYPCCEQEIGAQEIRFSAAARTVTARVDPGDPGGCVIVVEFSSLAWGAVGGSAPVILPGVLLGAVLKAQDGHFARGFLSNVQRVLESGRVGRDSARFPGMTGLREKLDIERP